MSSHPNTALEELFDEMLRKTQTPEFQENVRRRIKEENERFAEEARRFKPSWEDMHKPYDI